MRQPDQLLMKTCRDFQLVLQLKLHAVVSKKPIRESKRSFLGCLQCKRKKVKCDETKTTCNNCRRSHLDCVWPDTAARQLARDSALVSRQKRATLPKNSPGSMATKGPSLEQPSSQISESAPNGSLVQASSRQITESAPKREANLQVIMNPTDSSTPFVPAVPLSVASNFHISLQLDEFFFSKFAHNFLPNIAQPHFHETLPRQSLVLSAAARLATLKEIFIACGASLVAFDDSNFHTVAHERYTAALRNFLRSMKVGSVNGEEDWFFVAVQVLQTLCLRDSFGGSNATRCAAHFGAAYTIIASKVLRPNAGPVLPLDKMMLENFLFNYSITIFYCEHRQLERLVPDPFVFFSASNSRLATIAAQDGSPHASRMSLVAFQIAAKCSWLCRLKLPLDDRSRFLHIELLLLAETVLLSLDLGLVPTENRLRNTVSIAKVVVRTCIILLMKMLDPVNVRAMHLQHIVQAMEADVADPCNAGIIFPVWLMMIAASTSLNDPTRLFFRNRLQQLVQTTKSKICEQMINHLDGLWEIYSGEEPFELLFDTEVLDQICR